MRRSARDEAVDEAGVDLGPETGRAEQGQGCHPRRVMERCLERHSTSERMADQMGLGDIERVEEIDDRLGQRFEIARPDILAAFAMAGKVERIGLVLGGQGRLGEHPVVQIAAETVDEDHRPPVMVAQMEIADGPAASGDLLRFGGRLGLVGRGGGGEFGLEPLDEGVDLAVGDGLVRDDADQGAHGQIFLFLRDVAAQNAGDGGFVSVGDLGGFDIGQFVADIDPGAFRDGPGGDLALGHGQAELGHGDGMDLGHGHATSRVCWGFAAR